VTTPPDRSRPLFETLRRRMMARAGLVTPDLEVQSIQVNGVRRTFCAVAGRGPDVPLLLVLHGAGGTGLGTAALSGLHLRGPAAGCAVVFPDGILHVWNDRRDAPRLRRRQGVDDVAFMQALVEHLRDTGLHDGRAVYAVGMSNGGFLSEYLARHGLLELAGVVLVASSATVSSRRARPVPAPARSGGTRFLAFHGTADPIVPYGGGPIGLFGRFAARRPALGRDPRFAGRGVTAPVEEVAADWAAGGPSGLRPSPEVVRVPGPPGALEVERLSWVGRDGGDSRPSAQVYRIIGGGHTWPGGAQYLPARIVGRVAPDLDATGILLDFVADSLPPRT
jgi:polyhydroxybutyrate depolymerase